MTLPVRLGGPAPSSDTTRQPLTRALVAASPGVSTRWFSSQSSLERGPAWPATANGAHRAMRRETGMPPRTVADPVEIRSWR